MLTYWLKSSNFIFKWGLASLLLVLPIYPKFPLFNVPGTYVAIRAEDFLIAMLSIFLFFYILSNKEKFVGDKINQAIFLFLLLGAVSLVAGIFLTQTVIPHIGILHWVRRAEYFIPFFVAVIFASRVNKVRFFGEVLFIATFIVFLYGLGQKYLDWPVISTQNEEFSKGLALRLVPGARLHSTFGGHYDLAAFLILVFPLSAAFLFAVKNWLSRGLVFLGVFAPSFWLLMQTESRISFAAYIIGTAVTLLLVGRKLLIIPFIVVSIVATLLISDLGERYLYTINIYRQNIINKLKINLSPRYVVAQEVSPTPYAAPTRVRFSTPPPKYEEVIIEDRSTAIRFNIEWPRALRAFFKNPALGTGFSSITLATDNDFLRLLGEVGIAGTLAFFLIFARIWQTAVAVLKNKKLLPTSFQYAFIAGTIGATVALFINATFIDVFEASKVAPIFWILVGLSVGIARSSLPSPRL